VLGLDGGPGAIPLLATTPPDLTLPWILSFGLVFPVLTGVFVTSISFVVTYVSVRAYLRARLFAVLFLGCATLVFGLSSLLTAMLLRTEGLNFSGAVFALGAVFSGAFHLACASFTYLGYEPKLPRLGHAWVWVPVAFLCVALVAAAALEGVMPQFYVVGKGSTVLAQAALGAAALAFASSSALIFGVFSSSRSRVLLWYSLSLGVTAAGLLGVIVSRGDVQSLGMRLGWGAFYVGGLFLLTSVLSAERMADLAAPPR
jgi:hypothetical protein